MQKQSTELRINHHLDFLGCWRLSRYGRSHPSRDLVVSAPGGDHREAVFRWDRPPAIEDHRLVHADHLADGAIDVDGAFRKRMPHGVIGLARLDESSGRPRYREWRVRPPCSGPAGRLCPLAHIPMYYCLMMKIIDRQVVLHRRSTFPAWSSGTRLRQAMSTTGIGNAQAHARPTTPAVRLAHCAEERRR